MIALLFAALFTAAMLAGAVGLAISAVAHLLGLAERVAAFHWRGDHKLG